MFNSSNGGNWRMLVYVNTASYAEHVALIKGDLSSPEPVLVRMHAINIMTDVLGEQLSGRTGNEIQLAMQMIANEGRGLIVMLREPSPTTISDLVQRKAAGDGTSRNEIRNYGVGAQILNDLGVNHMILLSNVKRSIVGLDGYGLTIAGYREFDEGNDDHV
jgi:3,4-dihydroxy 2-butanone 4-phosphate synthase/GTP cyclohydrolase II